MKWKGPLHDGISQSLIGRILQDPFQAYIYLGLGLEQPTTPEPNLVWGVGGHVGLEHLIRDPQQIIELTQERWDEIQEIITDGLDKEFPGSPPTYPLSIVHMLHMYDDSYKIGKPFITEKVFAELHTTNTGRKVTLRGKVDGIHERTLVEHKCKGRIDAAQTRLEIPHDLQVILYCYVTGCREVIYDLIRIPDTQYYLPPRGKSSPSWYIKSLYTEKEWGDFPVYRKKHLWVQQIKETLTDEQVEFAMDVMVNPLLDGVVEWFEICSDPNFDWQNPKHYNHIIHRRPIRHFDPMLTVNYKGPYWNFITGGIEIDELQPVRGYFTELE